MLLPAAALQPAYADELAVRPATTGGDTALSGFEGDGAAASAGAPAAMQREDGTLVADGLVYTVTDGGLALVGFDGLAEGEDAPKEVVVPATISVDGKDAAVVTVDIVEDNVAESVVALTLPQSINDVNTVTLAAAFPNLAAIEIASLKASAPVAAGAAAIRAAYSSFGGILYKNAWVAVDSDASQTTLVKELVWAPPATVVARIPVECASIASGAFSDVKDLKTVVCFGVMEEIPQAQKAEDGTVTPGAFTDEQIQTVNVIVPQTGTVVPDGDHVSADVAVTDDSTMDIKREAWWKSGFASDRITLGEVCGSTTNTIPVNEEGVLETAEAEVAYAPETTQNSSSRKAGIEPPESAIPTPVPDDDELDPSESGLVFTHLADMTLSVSWKGDPTATPSRLNIPAYATINGVTYPVTEIAPEAFKGAVFLASIIIPETVKTIGEDAFAGCTNLSEPELSSALKGTAAVTSVEASAPLAFSEQSGANPLTPSQTDADGASIQSDDPSSLSAYSSDGYEYRFDLNFVSDTYTISKDVKEVLAGTSIYASSSAGYAPSFIALFFPEKPTTDMELGFDSAGILTLRYQIAGTSKTLAITEDEFGLRPAAVSEVIMGTSDMDGRSLFRGGSFLSIHVGPGDTGRAYLAPQKDRPAASFVVGLGGHRHDMLYYTESEADSLFAAKTDIFESDGTTPKFATTGSLKELNDKVFNADGSSKFATTDALAAAKEELEAKIASISTGGSGGGTEIIPEFKPVQNPDGTWNCGRHLIKLARYGTETTKDIRYGTGKTMGEILRPVGEDSWEFDFTHLTEEIGGIKIGIVIQDSGDAHPLLFSIQWFRTDGTYDSTGYYANWMIRDGTETDEYWWIDSDGELKHTRTSGEYLFPFSSLSTNSIPSEHVIVIAPGDADEGTRAAIRQLALSSSDTTLGMFYGTDGKTPVFATNAALNTVKASVEALKQQVNNGGVAAPEGNYFFGDDPFAGTTKTSAEIDVVLGKSGQKLSKVWFENANPDLMDGITSVTFTVTGSDGSITRSGWETDKGTTFSGIALQDFGNDNYGVKVKVELTGSANVPKSMSAATFFAQFARMHYDLAA